MKRSTATKTKKATGKGKAKQTDEEPEPIDPHPLHTQGSVPAEESFDLDEVAHSIRNNISPSPSPIDISTSSISDDELYPERYIKQAAGSNGKVAYVVYNGLSPGVFYNWLTCNKSMLGMTDGARRFQGYYTYDDAQNAWTDFQRDLILPPGLPPMSAKIIQQAEILRNTMRMNTLKAKEASIARLPPRLPPPLSPTAGPSRHRGGLNLPVKFDMEAATPTRNLPVKFEREAATPTHTPTRTPQKRSVAASPPAASSPPLMQTMHTPSTNPQFWVVFEGPEPGVYMDQLSAARALGGPGRFNDAYLIAPSLASANELFVQYYMLNRVRRWETAGP